MINNIEAINTVLIVASAWGENAEEPYGRVKSDMTDEQCDAMAGADSFDRDTVRQIRDLWIATEHLAAEVNFTLDELEGMNVYDYFARKLGTVPGDESLRDLPVGSECGADCRKAIDAAAQFKASADMAASWLAQSIVATCDDTVRIFWRG